MTEAIIITPARNGFVIRFVGLSNDQIVCKTAKEVILELIELYGLNNAATVAEIKALIGES